jgi:hypothetical protein
VGAIPEELDRNFELPKDELIHEGISEWSLDSAVIYEAYTKKLKQNQKLKASLGQTSTQRAQSMHFSLSTLSRYLPRPATLYEILTGWWVAIQIMKYDKKKSGL